MPTACWFSAASTAVVAAENAGASSTALTVIATVSESVSSPSSVRMVRTALVLLLLALVQVMVAIAVLMFATVPPNSIEVSSVPSPPPLAKVRPETPTSEKVPDWVDEMVTESIEVSSTSAMELPVMEIAVSSLPETAALTVFTGASFAAAKLVVMT